MPGVANMRMARALWRRRCGLPHWPGVFVALAALLLAPPAEASAATAFFSGDFPALESRFEALKGRSDRALQQELGELAQLTPRHRDARRRWLATRPERAWPHLLVGLSEARLGSALLEERPLYTLPPARRRAVIAAWTAAATAFEAALARDPALGPAHAGLLRLERAGARGRSARALFERARQHAGASWSVLDEMLQAAGTTPGMSRKTLEYLHGVTRRAERRHPDFRGLAATADCLLLDQVEAVDPEERREAIEAVPAHADSPACQDRLAALARARGDSAAALTHAESAEALQADDARRLQITSLRARVRGASVAREDLAAAIDRHGPTPANLRRLALLHWQLGEDADALRILGLAVVWFPLDEAAWTLRGQLLARDVDQLEAASQSLATALRLDPSPTDHWAELLRLQARLPCGASVTDFARSCAAWGCPDRVRRDAALKRLAQRLESRCH